MIDTVNATMNGDDCCCDGCDSCEGDSHEEEEEDEVEEESEIELADVSSKRAKKE